MQFFLNFELSLACFRLKTKKIKKLKKPEFVRRPAILSELVPNSNNENIKMWKHIDVKGRYLSLHNGR